ncbi:MAG: hypothetical protein SFY68_15375 [Candidatus Sumerlaeia bacterium]|nr:hypothetical protein [Candidatus Sumerlaeia bacterium]
MDFMEKYLRSDGRLGIILKLKIPPYGIATLQSFDDFDNIEKTEAMMLEVQSNWNILWPKMLSLLRKAIVDYGLEINLKKEEFNMGISDMEPDVYMGDRSDYFLSFTLSNDAPSWDYFIKADVIVHFQPSF